MEIKQNTLAYFESVEGRPFEFFIEKALIQKGDNGAMIIEGVASTTNIDHDNERMTLPALQSMANIINAKSVPLRVEHGKDDDSIIGKVFAASVDERGKLTIKAELSEAHPAAKMLYDGLKAGAKLGLSVGGRVKSAVRELSESAGKMIKTFYDVILDEVSVTPRPSNYDAWLVNKSITQKGEDSSMYYDTPIHERFLFENPHLDYLAVIEKSIPDQEWVKVETKLENNTMNKLKKTSDEVKTEEAEKGTEEQMLETPDTETADAKKEESAADVEEKESTEEKMKYASINYVDKKFGEVIGLLKQIRKDMTESEEKEETLPTKTETKEKDGDSMAEENKKPLMADKPRGGEDMATEEEPALKENTNNGGETKPEMADKPAQGADATQETAKEETSTKPEADKDIDDDEEVAMEASETGQYGSDYKLPDFQRAMAKFAGSKANPVDILASYISKFMDEVTSNLAATGKRVIGVEKAIADIVQNDKTIQKSITEWVNQPGEKRSVVFGVPYATTKTGQRFRLTPVESSEAIAKSANTEKDFKTFYQNKLSSTATGEGIH